MKFIISLTLIVFALSCSNSEQDIPLKRENLIEKVNVFLGSGGDHGQLSPAASYPFSMISTGPQTTSYQHMGYDFFVDTLTGFTHNRIEGVGCGGAGGNLLIKPILNNNPKTLLIKKEENASPGYYNVDFENGISSELTTYKNLSVHRHDFPNTNISYLIDFSHSFDGFDEEEHEIGENYIKGRIKSKTTCRVGSFSVYYFIKFENNIKTEIINKHKILVNLENNKKDSVSIIKIGFSSVSTDHGKKEILDFSFNEIKEMSQIAWEEELHKINVAGDEYEKELFYSLFYRIIQTPYSISEEDGSFRNIKGIIDTNKYNVYHGWAIWDNYRSQLPFLSIFYPDVYQNMMFSLSDIFKLGRHDWSENNEPAQTVRTEHAMPVILDAVKKGYEVDLLAIKDSLISDKEKYNYSTPDKALESYYDIWALANIMNLLNDTLKSKKLFDTLKNYKIYWNNDFADITAKDADSLKARSLYQGTVWQYRWSIPFDTKGLIELCGGESDFLKQLDSYWAMDMHNQGNQPSLHVPFLYNAAGESWKSQKIVRDIIADTIKQIYGAHTLYSEPYVGRVYNNNPKAFMYEMDDDLGTMSAWYVLSAIGFFPAVIGEPVYYFTTPLFENIRMKIGIKELKIKVKNFDMEHKYIKSVTLNGERIYRNYIFHNEIVNGGEIIFEIDSIPNKKFGSKDYFQSGIDDINK